MRALSLVLVFGVGCAGGSDPVDTATADPAAPCAASSQPRLKARKDRVTLELAGCGGFDFQDLEIVGQGGLELELYVSGTQIVPKIVATTPATFEALHLRGTWWAAGEDAPVLWRQGYQSWSPSGVFPLVAVEEDARGLPLVPGDDDTFDVALETPFTSWWAGLVGRPDGGSVLVGTLRASRTKSWVAVGPDALHLVWGGVGEAIQLAPGDAIYLDPAWFSVGGDPNALWRRWAEEAVKTQAPSPLPEAPPSGWATWYEHFDAVREEDVRANLTLAAELRGEPDLLALDVIQIDDGWSRSWGDWAPNDRFPSGMAALAADIAAEGFVAGIWMAPFLVSRDAPVYAAHADWWVRDDQGAELDDLGHAVLDATHPEAGAWMAQQVRARVEEGYGYLKLDFLHAGAVEGRRYAEVTGVEAYAIGMELLREAAGDAWLLACGAPMLPTLGWADSWRSGPDITFAVDGAPRPAYLRNQARATAARSFLNGLWWWNDADTLLVREPLSADWAQGAVVANAVSGGAWILGDDLVALPDDRLRLALHLDAGTVGGWVQPVDPLSFVSGFDGSPLIERAQGDDRVPIRWELPDGTVALLNLGGEPVEVEGPGGTELLTGAQAEPGFRTLEPGQGELWR